MWKYDNEGYGRRKAVPDGIKPANAKLGTTWWAKQWIVALERFTDSARLGRGRTYARAGQVVSIAIEPGVVKARVQGSRDTPYKIEMKLVPFTDAQWEKVTHALAEQAIFAAKLLAGEMPQNIEEAFRAAGVPLFPQNTKDLTTNCSCPDWANPCKHVAAVHYILGDQFDQDPFLIFRLRGRDREAILAELRALRAAGAEEPAADVEPEPEPGEPLPADPSAFWTPGEAMALVRPQVRPPAVEGALLRRLGPPPFGGDRIDAAASLGEAYRLMSRRALALVGEEEPAERGEARDG